MYSELKIVIPIYNEGENIKKTLLEIGSKVRTPHNIFIVYDFEEDNTLSFAKAFMEHGNNIHLLRNKYGEGVLNAIKTGFESIDDGVILVAMADRCDEFDRVDDMFQKINEGYDIVCGSRYMKGGRQIGGPKFKKFLSRLAGTSLHHLTGIPTCDATNNFKMYTKKVLSDIAIESNGGFELGLEIVVKAFLKGYKITEIPSVWRTRDFGRSKFKFLKWLPKYLRWYFVAIKGRLMANKAQ